MALQETLGQLELPQIQVRQVILDQQDRKETLERKEILEKLDHKAILVVPVQRVYQV